MSSERPVKLWLPITVAAVSFVPVLIVIIQNATQIGKNASRVEEINNLADTFAALTPLARLMMVIQEERDRTLEYLTLSSVQRDTKFDTNNATIGTVLAKLSEEYRNTDAAFENVSFTTWTRGTGDFRSPNSLLALIKENRKNLQPTSSTMEQVYFYTEINTVLLDWLTLYLRSIDESTSWIFLVSHQIITEGVEWTSLKKSMGTIYFAKGILPPDQQSLYIRSDTLGAAYMSTLTKITREADDLYLKYLDSSYYINLVRMEKLPVKNRAALPNLTKANKWTGFLDRYLKMMRTIADKIDLNVQQELKTEANKYSRDTAGCIVAIIVSLPMWLAVCLMLKATIDKPLKFKMRSLMVMATMSMAGNFLQPIQNNT